MNCYAGEAKVTFAPGVHYTLHYDWYAIGTIQSLYGTKSISTLFEGIHPELLADLMAAGLRKFHPEMTRDQILTMSPPYMVCAKAVDSAISVAYFGADSIDMQKKSLLTRIFQTIGIM